jgi:hypothetical protein
MKATTCHAQELCHGDEAIHAASEQVPAELRGLANVSRRLPLIHVSTLDHAGPAIIVNAFLFSHIFVGDEACAAD